MKTGKRQHKTEQKSNHMLAARAARPEGSIVEVGPLAIGGNEFMFMAGPCAVENETQLAGAAHMAAGAGARMLRGGAFKPRTSPYSFQGLGEEALRMLRKQGDALGMPVVTEVMSVEAIGFVSRYADMLQIGARNMQNYPLLRALGQCGKPVMLKRGLSATVAEWLSAAEYILDAGNSRVVLCERGIRTFETSTRNTLDLNSVALAKRMTHLPVIVDPSHGTGKRELVAPLAAAAVACGADGLIVEVHPDPANALSDGVQSLDAEALAELSATLNALVPACGRRLGPAPAGVDADEQLGIRRRRIDHIDKALVRLLSERARTALQIGDIKLAASLPLRNDSRERAVLEALPETEGEALDHEALERIFRTIMDETLRVEERAAA
jgi:3-deoxy-7-phosphoheptulonate synthase